jgi:hypothetical protein
MTLGVTTSRTAATSLRPADGGSTLNERVVVAVPVVTTMLVFVPVAAVVQSAWILLAVAVSLGFGVFGARDEKSYQDLRDHASYRQSVGEFVLAGLRGLQMCSTWALIILGVYFATRGIVHVIDAVFNLSWSRDTISFIVVIAATLFGVLAHILVEIESMAQTLYPTTAGVASGFAEMANKPRVVRALVICALLVTVAGILVLVLPIGQTALTWSMFGLLIAWFVIGATAEPKEQLSVVDRPRPQTMKAVEAAFAPIEGKKIAFPRTQRADVDPLLLDVDMLVYSEADKRGLAIDVKQAPAEPITWSTSSALVTASRALAGTLAPDAQLCPLVLLIDATTDEMFRLFCHNEHIAVIEIQTSTPDVKVTDSPRDFNITDAAYRLVESLSPSQIAASGVASELGRSV